MDNDVFLMREFVLKIKGMINEIVIHSKEVETIAKAKEIIGYIDKCTDTVENDKELLAKNIENSMKEAKNRNSEMESILYIIHGDLVSSRISVEKARELYEQYLNLEIFERKM